VNTNAQAAYDFAQLSFRPSPEPPTLPNPLHPNSLSLTLTHSLHSIKPPEVQQLQFSTNSALAQPKHNAPP